MALFPKTRQILIDVPIGLPWRECPSRPCELQARAWLRPWGRASSVFSPPCREAVHSSSYREACARNQAELGKQLSMQTWNICQKIAEVDLFLRAESGSLAPLREAHPEVCFAALNGGTAMSWPKKTAEGAAERLAVLRAHAPDAEALVTRVLSEQRRSSVQRDDVIDALACCVTANSGDLSSLHGDPLRDLCGLPMEMVHIALS